MISPYRQVEPGQIRPLQILAMTRQSHLAAAQLLSRAFVDDPVSVAAYPGFSAERRTKALCVDFRIELLECVKRGWPLVANDGEEVLGAAVIYPPGAYPLPVFTQWRLLFSSFLGNGIYDISNWKRWLDEVEKYHPSEPHYYLEYIGVEPLQQGKGVGSALLQRLTCIADADQAGCYLENANPHNLEFYQRHGFTVMKEKEIIGLTTWFMWREPIDRDNDRR